jgi:alkanesulfonate monooxygenase SsuD/methylene tetrahydromethanopterin reductase-like flavin-dependent oxidoreductase (luciferase family)
MLARPQPMCAASISAGGDETKLRAWTVSRSANRRTRGRARLASAKAADYTKASGAASRLRRYEAIGLDCVMLRFTPMLEGVDTFGTKVMPLLRCAARARPNSSTGMPGNAL